MSKAVKISLIVAAVLVALGVIVFVIVMTVKGWNFSENSTRATERCSYLSEATPSTRC